MSYPPENIEALIHEAERLAEDLRRSRTDLAEVKKFAHLLRHWDHQVEKASFYLKQMAENPPPRSRRTRDQYKALSGCWDRLRQRRLPSESTTWVLGEAVRIATAWEKGIR